MRNINLDILKVILALMVVGIHTGFLADFTKVGNYITTQGIFRIAVPIFLLINGYYFYNITVNKNYIHWFKRVLYLYLFWMLFYTYDWFPVHDYSLLKLITFLLIGYFHLWYFPSMIGAALITIFVKEFPLKMVILFIILTFTIGIFMQYAGNYHIFKNTSLDKIFNYTVIYRNFLFFAFPFFFIGFLINKYKISNIISLNSSIILTVLGFVFLIIESYLNYTSTTCNGGFDNFISLIIISPALFLLFMKLSFSSNHGKTIALYSAGIYFIHPILYKTYQSFFGIDATILTFVTGVSAIVASYFLIKINTKLKVIL